MGTTVVINKNGWYEDVKIAEKTVNVQLDTGARCNVISIKDLQRLGINTNIKKPEAQLKSYSRHVITILPCEYKRKTYQVKFRVVDIPAPPVCSANTCKEMGLVERVHAVETSTSQDHNADPFSPPKFNPTQQHELLKGYDELFTGLGCLPGEHTIEIDRSYTPVVHPPRRVPLALKEQIKAELQRMEDAGVIVKQTKPTDWVNSMVTVIKPEKIGVCIDPRDLNRAIKREHYPMKTMEEVVAGMPEAKVFSVLDATSGYWHKPVTTSGYWHKPVTLSVDASSKGQFERTWSSTLSRRKTSCICLQSVNPNTAKISTNRERDFGYCIWYNQVSPVPVWKRSTCHIRPQTTGIYIQ